MATVVCLAGAINSIELHGETASPRQHQQQQIRTEVDDVVANAETRLYAELHSPQQQEHPYMALQAERHS